MPEEWTEPLKRVMGEMDNVFMLKIIIAASVKDRLLSEKALRSLMQFLFEKENCDELLQQVDMGDGVQESLLNLSVQLAEQSYTLACTTFDEPQLAILAVNVMCKICNFFPNLSDVLIRLSGIDPLAHARVLTYGIGITGLPLQGNFDNLLPCILEDFRTLIQRRHSHTAHLLVLSLSQITPLFPFHSSLEKYFELMHLMAEHYLEKGDYIGVLNVPKMFEKLWKIYEEDEETYRMNVRPTKLCIARSLEATGQLSRARDTFISCKAGNHLSDLQACISGSKIYASIKEDLPIEGIRTGTFSSRVLSDGNIALLFRQKTQDKDSYKFLTYAPETCSTIECPLPTEARGWANVVAIPDKFSEPLRLLVCPGYDPSDNLSFLRAMTGMSLLETKESHQKATERVEIWEYRHKTWYQIKTRGCIPDCYVVSRPGSACSKVQGKLVVFGGMDAMEICANHDRSSNAFILDLRSLEWFRIPHPYMHSLFQDPSPRHCVNSLPYFQAVWNVEVGGCEMIAMLRKGNSEVNSKTGDELVPKFALDLLEIMPNDAGRPAVSWVLDVPTIDRCGYVAPFQGVSCMQIGSIALALGSKTSDPVMEKSGKMTFLDTSRQVFDIFTLDVTNMQWRGINIHNLELLAYGSDPHAKCHFVSGSKPDMCYAITQSSDMMRICQISNLHCITDSLTKPLSNRKKLSKKNTLSYQLAKARKESIRPLRECASCRVFEHDGVSFKCCSRCRVPYYCSTSCQKRHWKAHHKQECVPTSSQESSK